MRVRIENKKEMQNFVTTSLEEILQSFIKKNPNCGEIKVGFVNSYSERETAHIVFDSEWGTDSEEAVLLFHDRDEFWVCRDFATLVERLEGVRASDTPVLLEVANLTLVIRE